MLNLQLIENSAFVLSNWDSNDIVRQIVQEVYYRGSMKQGLEGTGAAIVLS